MRQAILDSRNNVMDTLGMAKSWQDCFGEKMRLAQIDDEGNGSSRRIWIDSDLMVHFYGD